MTDDSSMTHDDASVGAPQPADLSSAPNAVDILTESLNIMMEDLAPFALGGLGLLLAGMASSMVIMFLSFGCMFGGFIVSGVIMGAGGATGSDGLAAVGAVGGMLGMMLTYVGFFVVLFGGIAVTLAPMVASLQRAIDEHLAGGEKVGIGSPFKTVRKQPVADILATAGFLVLIFVGMPFAYVGALLVAFFLGWWTLFVHLDGVPVFKGAGSAFRHAKNNLTWHLGVFGLGIPVGLLANYVPVVGPMFAMIYSIKAYRTAYPRAPIDRDDPDLLD